MWSYQYPHIYGRTHCCIFNKSTALCEKALHYTKLTTINKYISKKKISKYQNLTSLFRFFCTLSGRLLSRNTLVFGRFNSKERTNVHRTPFFFTSLIPHCLKSQLSKYCGKKTLLGVAKSLEVTFFVFLGVGAILKICLTSSYTPIWLCPGLLLELLYQCMPFYTYT